MADRYANYGRPRSPLYNPQRASLPIITPSYSPAPVYEHSHAVPIYRREDRPKHTNTYPAGPVITTTYKIEPPSSRSTSRTRSATLDSRPVPTIVTPTTRSRPVIHRPASPAMKTPRSGEEEYYDYAIPAATKSHRRSRSSLDKGRSSRDDRYHTSRSSRPVYPNPIVRHADTAVDDYGADGYGYTNPRDLVAYDLMNSNTAGSNRRSRRDSHDGGRGGRPVSITGLADVQSPRSYEPRERGPPPSTRGFDRIPQNRDNPPPPQRGPISPVDAVQRPVREVPSGGLLEPEMGSRRGGSRRPVSMYHDSREAGYDARRREEYPREEYNDPREDELRDRDRHPRESRHRHERHKSHDEKGYRVERSDRDRIERSERSEKHERERAERDRPEKVDRDDRENRSERTRDKLVAGLSIASAALGLGAVGKSKDEDEPSRREEEPRRRHEPVDLTGRDTKERRHRERDDEKRHEIPLSPRDVKERHREDELPPMREVKDRHREDDSPRELKERHSADSAPREIKDRHSPDNTTHRRHDDIARPSPDSATPRDEPLAIKDRRSPDLITPRNSKDQIIVIDEEEKGKPRNEAPVSADDDSIVSDEQINARPRRPQQSDVPFNPKDTMDLMALKAALNKDSSAPPEPIPISKPRASMVKDPREILEIRNELANDRGRREPLEPTNNRQLRVVSPPREKLEEKPVKGILRQPRDRFPEDPSPIREGVAPLKDAKKDGVPPDARWTKIARKLVNPEALEVGKERYEARDDFVIVLRVLSREEIQAYATATQQIRGLSFPSLLFFLLVL